MIWSIYVEAGSSEIFTRIECTLEEAVYEFSQVYRPAKWWEFWRSKASYYNIDEGRFYNKEARKLELELYK